MNWDEVLAIIISKGFKLWYLSSNLKEDLDKSLQALILLLLLLVG